ncbi:MAG: hypothetical protein IID54_00495, partial [Proteobacteria bacterium]|nr:hypothetical protein [Pseudomonadota bacterium]
MKTRHLQRCGMIAGAILAALLFFMGGAALRLLMGPVSLGPFAGVIEDALNSSVSGLIVRFDRAVLEWTRADGRVNLLILGTKIFDVQGRIIAQAPQADLDFDAASLLRGEFVLKRFALMDVQLTAVRNQEGVVRLGFGQIAGDIDLLAVIRGMLGDGADRGGSLDSFAIRNARLAFHDEPTGLFVVSPDISITLEKAENGAFEAALAAEVEISGVPAQITARVVLRDDGSVEQGTLDVQGFDIGALAANSPKFAALAPYPVEIDLQASFALGPDGVWLRTEFALQGAGTVALPILDPRTVEIEAFNITGSYDTAAHLLVLESADFTGADASASASASAGLSGEFSFDWLDGALASVQGDIIARDVRYTAPEQFAEPLQFSEIAVQGTFDRVEQRFEWQRIALQGEGLSAEFSGTVVLAEDRAPALTVTGTIDTLNKEDVLRYWPLTLNDGARDWIVNNIFEGDIGPVQVAIDLPVGFDEGRIADEAIAIGFPVRGMAAQYMSGLTWITQANGAATLSGDAFRATVDSAVIGPLVLSNGDIDIPDLQVGGAPGLFQAHV